MKVRSTRTLPGPAWRELSKVEIAPVDRPGPDVEAVVVVNEPVDLDCFPALRLVADYSVGYDRIDIDACAARGIAVTNTPGVLDAATADLAMALILAARRRVGAGDRLVRAHGWRPVAAEELLPAREVTGTTLGIVGLGRIGSAVAQRARGFDMTILSVTSRDGNLDELMRASDVVSVHVPLTADTAGLISRERLALLRDGATFVNTARGGVVDEAALVDELVSGRLSAGLDVFSDEPHVPEALLSLDNVVLTPHIASGTLETRVAMTRVVVDNVLAAERGEPLPNRVV